MQRRTIALLGLVIASLMLIPQFSAMPGGIGSGANAGCTCHAGGNDGSTVILVEGLPEVFNASETYPFTITLVNDEMTLYGNGDPAQVSAAATVYALSKTDRSRSFVGSRHLRSR